MGKKRDIGDKNINYKNLEKFKENLDNIIPKRKTLSQAEYDLLTYEEKHNGTVYFISDGIANISEADKDYIDSQDNQILESVKTYTDTVIVDLIDSAPEELNTLNKLAIAVQTNNTAIDTLNTAVEDKLNKSDIVAITTDEIDALIAQAEEEAEQIE